MLPAAQPLIFNGVFFALLAFAVVLAGAAFGLSMLIRYGRFAPAVRVLTGLGGAACVLSGGSFLTDYKDTNETAGALLAVGGLMLVAVTAMRVWERLPDRGGRPGGEDRFFHERF